MTKTSSEAKLKEAKETKLKEAKEATHLNIIESFSEFKDLKSIDKATLMNVIEDVFKAMLRKR